MRKTDNYSLGNLDMIDLELPRVLQKDAKLTIKKIGIASVFATKNYDRLVVTPLCRKAHSNLWYLETLASTGKSITDYAL